LGAEAPRAAAAPATGLAFASAGRALGQRVDDFLVIWEAPGLVFAVDELAVRLDVENAAGPFDEIGLDAELFLDSGRQTGGLGEVASDAAVGDGDLHAGSS